MDIFKAGIYGGNQCYHVDVESRVREVKKCERISDLIETRLAHHEGMQKTVHAAITARIKAIKKARAAEAAAMPDMLLDSVYTRAKVKVKTWDPNELFNDPEDNLKLAIYRDEYVRRFGEEKPQVSDYKKVFEKAWYQVAQAVPKQISSPFESVPLLAKYRNKTQEYFLAVLLDGNHAPIRVVEVTKGLVNQCQIHPREVFREAIRRNAVAVILAHNHPSGHGEPSQQDRDITYRLKEAGVLLGIEVLDHIIVHQRGYYSFLEEGEF